MKGLQFTGSSALAAIDRMEEKVLALEAEAESTAQVGSMFCFRPCLVGPALTCSDSNPVLLSACVLGLWKFAFLMPFLRLLTCPQILDMEHDVLLKLENHSCAAWWCTKQALCMSVEQAESALLAAALGK